MEVKKQMNVKKIISVILSLIIGLSAFVVPSLATETEQEQSNDISLETFLANNYKYETGEISSEIENGETTISTNRLIVSTVSDEAISDYYGAVDSIEPFDDCYVLQYSSSEDAQYAYKMYSNSNEVEYVEYDEVFTIEEVYGNETTESEILNSFDISWGAYTVESYNAKRQLNSTQIVQEDVVVAVIDTGVEASHTFFKDSAGNSRVLSSDRVMDNAPTENSHGTHVAGIIVDNTNENVKIRSYNYFWYREEENTASKTTLMDEIYSAIEDEVDVINMSLGGEGRSYNVEKAVKTAIEKGIVVITSAGNYAVDASGYYPQNIPEIISVASTNSDDKPRETSNYGTCVDIAAPGGEILSTVIGGKYDYDSGTSMASPFVAACAAMLKSINKQYTHYDIESIMESTVYVPDGWDFDYGVGIVNFSNCISQISASTPKISFNSNYDAVITSSSSNSVIYYTTDGSDPIVGTSKIYESPIDTSSAVRIKAIAYEDGKVPSAIATLKIKWSENMDVRYKGRESVKTTYDIVKYTCSNEEIVSFDGKQIKGESIGEATVTIFYESGQRVTYKVTVDFAPFQWFHEIIYKLFGVLLWSL